MWFETALFITAGTQHEEKRNNSSASNKKRSRGRILICITSFSLCLLVFFFPFPQGAPSANTAGKRKARQEGGEAGRSSPKRPRIEGDGRHQALAGVGGGGGNASATPSGPGTSQAAGPSANPILAGGGGSGASTTRDRAPPLETQVLPPQVTMVSKQRVSVVVLLFPGLFWRVDADLETCCCVHVDHLCIGGCFVFTNILLACVVTTFYGSVICKRVPPLLGLPPTPHLLPDVLSARKVYV